MSERIDPNFIRHKKMPEQKIITDTGNKEEIKHFFPEHSRIA